MKESPCLTCSRVKDPKNCENKQCRLWQSWYLKQWKHIHAFYEKYKEEPYELEK